VTRAVLTIHPPRRTTCNLPAQMTGFRAASSSWRAGAARLHSRSAQVRATSAWRRTLPGRRSDARSAIRRYRGIGTHPVWGGAAPA